MAVSFVSASQGGVAGAGTLTISHTVASGSDRALLVIVQTIAADNASGGSATWRSASMGSSVLSHWGGANAATYAWLLVAPEVGSGNVVITFNSGSTFANAVVLSFDGVDQSTPVSATATYNDTFATSPRSLSITTPADGACADMLYVANAGTTMTPTGSGQSAAGSKMVNSGVWSLAGSYRTGAASVMDWTFSGGSFAAVQGAVALNPSSGAPPPPPPPPPPPAPGFTLRIKDPATGLDRLEYLFSKVYALRLSDDEVVKVWAGPSTDEDGDLILSDAALTEAPHLIVTVETGDDPDTAGAAVVTPSS